MPIPVTDYQKIQDKIHVMYEGNIDTPAAGDDDFDIRENLINQAIAEWENHDGMLWNELYGTHTGTTTAATTIDLPDNFNYPTGFVRIGSSDYRVANPHEAHTYVENTSEQVCWVTGKPGAYTLNFLTTLEADLAYSIPYYKLANQMDSSDMAAIPDMSDPHYIVNFVLAELFRFDNNYAGYNSAKQDAERRLEKMVIRNAMNPYFQPNNIPDLLNIGFGV